MKEFENGFGAGFIVGVVFSLFVGWVIVDKVADAQTPITWCESIAEASKTEPYKVVYDRCMADYEQRRN